MNTSRGKDTVRIEDGVKYEGFEYFEIDQRTDDWHRLRLGLITGSRFKDVVAIGAKGQYLKARADYKRELVAERIIGFMGRKDVYVTEAMRWGQMNEETARTTYQLRTGNRVTPAGFAIMLDEKGKRLNIGVSSDGLIGDDGNLEIKSPEPHNYLYNIIDQYARTMEMPAEYKAQVQGQMLVLKRYWTDFVGSDGRMPAGLDMLAIRVERDDEYCEWLLDELFKFEAEVQADFRKFLRYLPVANRTCTLCGLVFTDQIATCPSCKFANTIITEILQPAELQLSSLDDIKQLIEGAK